ncbi:erythromycin esterase family protein [Spirosoma soli]|uniref:Erythromycin esterase family protein n=1 Tax=Spirosoma soli TaxID=1770529 RepID=A0ABW5M0X2_9BACT
MKLYLIMNTLKWLLATALTFATGFWIVTESKQIDNRPPATVTVLNGKAVPINTNDFAQFRRQIMPLIEEMAQKKVVSLGEGTHGTSEFYKVRYWITKILVEEKGFTNVAFENDYADSYLLNQALKQGRTDYDALMKQHLIAIWRNEEVKELLTWMQTYNKTHKRPISFGGLDHMFMKPDAKALTLVTNLLNNKLINVQCDQLRQLASARDSMWYNSNRREYNLSDTVSNENMLLAYEAALRIDKLTRPIKLSSEQRSTIARLTENIRMQCEGGYTYLKTGRGRGNRDSAMAVMATRIMAKPGDKLIIWAHDAHVSRKPVYNNSVGGMGGFIERKLPGQYFVLGTGTANGTFAATDDQFITHASQMKSFPLETPVDTLWETQLAKADAPAFYVNGVNWNKMNTNLSNRVIGYGSDNGKRSHDKSSPLNQMYDAYLFIRNTKAATFIP